MFKLLLRPGIAFIGRLPLTRKFAVIFLLYLIPVGYIAYYSLTTHATNIQSAERELRFVDLLYEFKPLFINLAKSRGLTNAYLNGNSSVKTQIENARSQVDQQFSQIQAASGYSHLDNNTKERLKNMQSDWLSLKTEAFSLQLTDAFSRHSNLVNETLSIMSSIRERTELMTDPQTGTAFLIKAFVEDLPLLSETTGQTRGVGAGIAAKGAFTSDSFVVLSNNYRQLEQLLNTTSHSIEGAMLVSSQIQSLSQSHQQLKAVAQEFLTMTKESMLDPDKIAVTSDQYFSLGTQVIEKTVQLYDRSYREIKSALNNRIDDIYAEAWLNVISSVALILTAIYLFASLTTVLTDSINRIKECVNAVAQGNLTVTTEILSKDEMRKIGDDINKMVENTKSLVVKVLEATNDLVNTAETNNASAEITRQKINQQNIEVEQVATAMNEMSATVQEVANNAEQSAASTSEADKLSNQGYSIVTTTTESITQLAKELSDASSSVSELQGNVQGIGSVLDVIQGIADQTNLLALNAAIEAARAGESGRGFAVVADEVRTLASKTQESTEEIRQMIDKLQSSADLSVRSMTSGTEKSARTVEDANKAGEALQQISDAVSHIRAMGEQIASAASEQSSVAEDINRSVMQVKSISEDTGNAANQSAKNSQFLQDIANNLKQLVGQFKV